MHCCAAERCAVPAKLWFMLYFKMCTSAESASLPHVVHHREEDIKILNNKNYNLLQTPKSTNTLSPTSHA